LAREQTARVAPFADLRVGFIAFHLFYYIVSKALGQTLGTRYNDETVFGDILSKESTVARRVGFSFLYRHFISISTI
jgi:hypothetical protein